MRLLLLTVDVQTSQRSPNLKRTLSTHLNSLDLATSPSEYARRALSAIAGKRRVGIARAATRVLEINIVVVMDVE